MYTGTVQLQLLIDIRLRVLRVNNEINEPNGKSDHGLFTVEECTRKRRTRHLFLIVK